MFHVEHTECFTWNITRLVVLEKCVFWVAIADQQGCVLIGDRDCRGVGGQGGQGLAHVLQGQGRGVTFFGQVREDNVLEASGAVIIDDAGDQVGGLNV